MTPTRLNAFQQVMRLWDEVHPYNALHAICISAPRPLPQLQSAWRDTLRTVGVGRVHVDGSRYTHTAALDTDASSDVVTPAAVNLDELLSGQLEQPFLETDTCPFRAFSWPTPEGQQIIGITYHHWASDSFSIRRLMRNWFERLFGTPSETKPIPIAKRGLWHHFGPDAAGWNLDEGIGSLLRYVTRFSRTRRCDEPMGSCGQRVTTHQLPLGVIDGIVANAKRRGVTVNDVLSAVLLQAIDQHGVHRAQVGRDELAIGTVADLRGGSRQPLTDFGMFLGFTTTQARPADLKNFEQLLRRVAAQNAHHKRTHGPQASLLRMGAALAESKLASPRGWAEGYRRRMPLAASISNVRLTGDWLAHVYPCLLCDYYRVTPTGPMIPLLFTPTTVGNGISSHMNFCLTANVDHIDASRQQAIAGSLIDKLSAFSRGR